VLYEYPIALLALMIYRYAIFFSLRISSRTIYNCTM